MTMVNSNLKISVLSAAVMAVLASQAFAGQEPYLATVGDDIKIKKFYVEPKLYQFTHSTPADDVLVKDKDGNPIPGQLARTACIQNPTLAQCKDIERFTADPRSARLFPRDVCNVNYPVGEENPTYIIDRGNAGYFEWIIRLPKKPNSDLSVIVQCGVLKPNAYALWGQNSVKICAGETGETPDVNCSREFLEPGVNPINAAAQPRLTVGALSRWDLNAFNLTAYRNPSSYELTTGADGRMTNSTSLQALDGSSGARAGLLACAPKTVLAKIPVSGQVNALGQVESDLEAGDLVAVRMTLPRGHTMDMFCNEDSVKLYGTGEPDALLPTPPTVGQIVF